MGSSVAGQIRIDLIAQAAQFNAGLREAGQGIDNFRDKYKSLRDEAKRAAAEQSAWETSMRRLGGGAAGVQGFFDSLYPGMSPDQARVSQNRQRRLASTPWNVTSYALSQEAAERAAILGREMPGGSFGGGVRDLTGRLKRIGVGTFGEFGKASVATEGFSAMTRGAGMFAAGVTIAAGAAKNLGDEIRAARKEANELGMTYDQFVKSRGLAEHWRFTEGAALSAGKGWEGLQGSLAAGFGGVGGFFNAITGRGRSGWSDFTAIAELERLDEANRLTARRASSAEKELMSLTREADRFGKTAEAIARANWIEKFSPSDEQIRRWDEMSQRLLTASKLKDIDKYQLSIEDQVAKLKHTEDEYERIKFRESLDSSGLSEEKKRDRMEGFEEMQATRNRLKAEADRDAVRKKELETKAKQEAAESDEAFRRKEERKKQLRTPAEVFADELKDLIGEDLTPEQFRRERKRLRKAALGGMMGEEEAPTVSPVAAMQANSKEAYDVMVKSMLNDPKTQLARQSLTKLDAIEKNTRNAVEATGVTLDF